jgi:hypothetical protein
VEIKLVPQESLLEKFVSLHHHSPYFKPICKFMKKVLLNLFVAGAVSLLSAGNLQAQIVMPQPSPAATVNQKVGITDVTVNYSRPSTRNRQIFGEVVPYGKPWRTGANQATKFTFKDDVTIAGNKVPAGEYALYTIPEQNEWTIVLNKNTGLGGDVSKYKNEDDVARFKVKTDRLPSKVETFTINFADLTSNSATAEIKWDNTAARFKIEQDVDAQVMAQIQEKVINGQNVAPNVYAAAANYYLETDRDPKMALDWINKATEKEAPFWLLHAKAKIQAKNKDFAGAVQTAEQSIQAARQANNEDYVRMNEKLIMEWKPQIVPAKGRAAKSRKKA